MKNSKRLNRCYRRGAFTVAEARASDKKSLEKLNALQCVVRSFNKATTLGQQKNEWLKFHATLQDQRREAELSIRKFHRLVHDIEGASQTLLAGESTRIVPCPCGVGTGPDTGTRVAVGDTTECNSGNGADVGPFRSADGLSVPWCPGDLVKTGWMLARFGRTVAADLGGARESSGQRERQRVAPRTRAHDGRTQQSLPRLAERIRCTSTGTEEQLAAFPAGLSASFCSTQATAIDEQDLSRPLWSSKHNPSEGELLRDTANHSPERTRPQQIAAFLKLLRQYGLALIAAEQELEIAHAAAHHELLASKKAIRLEMRNCNAGLSHLGYNHTSKEAHSSWEPGELTDEEEAFIDMCTENDDDSENTFRGGLFSQVRREYQDEIERLELDFRADYVDLKGKNLNLAGQKKDLLSRLHPSPSSFPDRTGESLATEVKCISLAGPASTVSASGSDCVADTATEAQKNESLVVNQKLGGPADSHSVKESGSGDATTRPAASDQSQAVSFESVGVPLQEGAVSCSEEGPSALLEAQTSADAIADTFNFICRQFSYPGAPRELLLNRLKLEFPDAPVGVLREATEVHKKIALLHQRRNGRCAEFTAARLAALKAAKEKYDNVKLSFGGECVRRKEKERQIKKSLELRQKLESQRAAFHAKEELRRQAEEAEKALELGKQEKAQLKERKRQQEMKEKVLHYIQAKEELLQQQQAAAELQAREEAKESAARRKRDAIRVARRRELDEWKCREREARRRDQLRRQEEIMERIRRAAEKLAVVAVSDPDRLHHTTEAAQSRVEAIKHERVMLGDPHIGRFKHFGISYGFDTDKLLRDMRLRLSVALFEAGLHGSRAGHEALLVVPPPRAPNPLHDSSLSLW